MNKEDKELLLKDLCARLPYGVICEYTSIQDGLEIRNEIGKLTAIDKDVSGCKHIYAKIDGHLIGLSDFKPYLRQMYSMTEDEQHEYNLIAMHTIVTSKGFVHIEATDLIDWLNAHYFDYRGLIDRGLAIEVTEQNNPYN